MKMKNKEIELNRKLLEHEYYKQLLDNYQASLEAARILFNDVENTLLSLDSILNSKEDITEIYMPIGSGSYVKLQCNKNEKVLVNLGSKIFAEYTLQQALEFLKKKKQKIAESMNETSKIIEELTAIMSRLERQISELAKEDNV